MASDLVKTIKRHAYGGITTRAGQVAMKDTALSAAGAGIVAALASKAYLGTTQNHTIAVGIAAAGLVLYGAGMGAGK